MKAAKNQISTDQVARPKRPPRSAGTSTAAAQALTAAISKPTAAVPPRSALWIIAGHGTCDVANSAHGLPSGL